MKRIRTYIIISAISILIILLAPGMGWTSAMKESLVSGDVKISGKNDRQNVVHRSPNKTIFNQYAFIINSRKPARFIHPYSSSIHSNSESVFLNVNKAFDLKSKSTIVLLSPPSTRQQLRSEWLPGTSHTFHSSFTEPFCHTRNRKERIDTTTRAGNGTMLRFSFREEKLNLAFPLLISF